MSKKLKTTCEHLKQADLTIEGHEILTCTYCKKCKEILEPKEIETKTLKKLKKEIKEINRKIF